LTAVTEDITPFLPEKDFFIGAHENKIPQTTKQYQDGLLEGLTIKQLAVS